MISTTSFIAALLSGVAIHLCVFIRGEWHLHVTHVVFSDCALLVFVWSLLFHFDRNFPASHAYTTFKILGSYLLGLFGGIEIYRVFFHRLRHYPGPRIAAVSKLWYVWQSRNCINHPVLQRMFEEYGYVVRVGEFYYRNLTVLMI